MTPKGFFTTGLEIIPFDSVEYVEDRSGSYLDETKHINIAIHFRDSKKIHPMIDDDANRFCEEYEDYLTLLSSAIMLLDDEETKPIKREKNADAEIQKPIITR